jgi:hypothetical protein
MSSVSGPTKFDDEEVDAVWSSDFGKVLFNLYTHKRGRASGCLFLFSKRLEVVRRMLRAMLDAEEELK